MEERPYYLRLWEDISKDKRMVFISGPRQAGKTTLARAIGGAFSDETYFNWDYPENKRLLFKDPTFFAKQSRRGTQAPLVIFDEIHKYRAWKNYLKGIYDQFHEDYRFLVLGSGRLDAYRKGGDSLAGRYGLFTLWPFTVTELSGLRRTFDDFSKNPLFSAPNPRARQVWRRLERLSGFPEPFLSGREQNYRRWSRIYHQQLIREDIRDISGVRDIEQAATLFALLASRVGSLLSVQNLAEDLQVSHTAIRSWLNIFESLYLIFRLSPWTKKISRAISLQKKLYLMDAAQILSEAARFENMAALELWRAVHSWTDWGFGAFDLHYLRNKEKQEVDFLITKGQMPFLLVEAKLQDEEVSPALRKFQEALKVPAVQVVQKPDVRRRFPAGRGEILIVTAADWFAALP